MISIITPTYNREKELGRVYESLLKQSNKDFEWLVVDDGSVDNTKSLVENYIKEKKINIRLLTKENGGKPSAYNLGVENAKGELLLCLDSDDALVEDAIETILEDYFIIKDNEQCAGLVYNCEDIASKEIIGTPLPDGFFDTYYNIYEKYQVKGDKAQVIKTKVAKEYPFPIIDGEKFVPEALVNNRISKKYNFLYRDKAVMQKEYLTDGYSANYFNLVKRNPMSNRLYFKELYELKSTLYNVYGYILFSIYAHVGFKKIVREHKAKFKVICLYIPTLIVSKLK